MMALEGGSFGLQIGGEATDFVLLVMNERGASGILASKVKLGADASVAAGPVGRDASAGTDLKLDAEILSYSRTHGIFAGAALDGTVVMADKSGDQAMYGDATRQMVLSGQVPVPADARPLVAEVHHYAERSGD